MNDEVDQITNSIKNLFIENKNNQIELSKLIDEYLIPKNSEKKINAEVSTPFKLRQEMINVIPDDFWKTPKKVFEPCSGKGGFLIDIIEKFSKHLSYKTIVEECLYFSDINELNIYINKLLIDPDNKYKLNYHIGDTLKLNIKQKWEIDKFDAIISNPPYNDNTGNKGAGHKIWDKFVINSINNWLKQDGYLLTIHPSTWRQKNHKILKILKPKQIIYLEIHNVKDGIKTFKCSTRYDWYLLQNKDIYKDTLIKDEEGVINKINLKNWIFIPNMKFEIINKLINDDDNEKITLIYDRSNYGSDKKHLSKIETNEFKYPCIKYVNKNKKLNLMYSNINTNGHFGIKKFVFSCGKDTFIDKDGEYGLTQWSGGIVDTIENLKKIEICFNNEKFKEIIKSIQINSIKYNYTIIKLFKKDFYNEFINK